MCSFSKDAVGELRKGTDTVGVAKSQLAIAEMDLVLEETYSISKLPRDFTIFSRKSSSDKETHGRNPGLWQLAERERLASNTKMKHARFVEPTAYELCAPT
jgi:hypothetical protein